MGKSFSMCKSLEVITLIEQIEKAFSWRTKPEVLAYSHVLTHDELSEVNIFSALSWSETTSSLWEKYFEVIHYFSPDAFRYFLPGILKASLSDNIPGLIVCEVLISNLNRSPNFDNWEDFFINRWTGLTVEEYEALQAWVLWQIDFANNEEECMSLSVAIRTLDILKNTTKHI